MTEGFILRNTFKTLREFTEVFEKYDVRPCRGIQDLSYSHGILI